MPKKAKKSDPAAELSVKMTQALEAQRVLGGGAYPTMIARLRELADPTASDDVARKALGKPPWSQRVTAGKKKDLSAPAVLRDDMAQLAASPAILDFALRTACTEAKPTATLAQLKKKIDEDLGEAFEREVRRRIAENALPPDVEWLPKTQVLHPLRLPLPLPPHIALAERLVRVLEAQRRLGLDSYPVRLGRLVELTALLPSKAVRNKAIKQEPFAGGVVPLLGNHDDSPVVLAEDVEQATDHPGLLALLLEMKRDDVVQAFSIAELKARLDKRAQAPFADALARRMESGTLQAGVAWIGVKVGKKTDRLLFRLEDAHAGRPAAAPAREQPAANAAAPADGADFDTAFDELFTRLDRARGSNNFVSLVDLRRALPLDRATFDACLRRLRQAHRYSLSAAEGRDGLTEEQRAAGVMEEGTLLLFVSRREA